MLGRGERNQVDKIRVLVCGGRDFDNESLVFGALDQIEAEMGPLVIIEGGARGADSLAALWADDRGAHHLQFKADWQKHGKGAGPIRNQTMLDDGKPDLVVGFPGGVGTADMLRRAKAAGIPVIEGNA